MPTFEGLDEVVDFAVLLAMRADGVGIFFLDERCFGIGALELGEETAVVVGEFVAQIEGAIAFGESHGGKFVIGETGSVDDVRGALFGLGEDVDVCQFGSLRRGLGVVSRVGDGVCLLLAHSHDFAVGCAVLLSTQNNVRSFV